MTDFTKAKMLELIENKKAEIKAKQDEIDSFSYPDEKAEKLYCESLDECYKEMFGMSPSYILQECDPTQYRCGLIDFTDSLDVTECDEYDDLETELVSLQDELESLEDELAEMEGEDN